MLSTDSQDPVIVKKLSHLKRGQTGIIHSFSDNEIFLKLMEMGCVPGEKVKINEITTLGDPISIKVAGYILSLRRDEADHIFVEPAHNE